MTHFLSTNPCRFHEILKNLTDSDEGKLHILKVVYEVWRNHPQVRTTHKHFCRSAFGSAWMFGKMELKVTCLCCSQMIAVLVDKMIRTQIVDCAAVANWLFSQDMAHEFTRWDVRHDALV